MHDTDRDKTDEPAAYPTMPPLDAVEPDIEQEGEAPEAPEDGWGGAARAAEGEMPGKETGR